MTKRITLIAALVLAASTASAQQVPLNSTQGGAGSEQVAGQGGALLAGGLTAQTAVLIGVGIIAVAAAASGGSSSTTTVSE